MVRTRVILLTTLAMIAFAGNSLLCRIALRDTSIDAASFTTVRLVSGAIMLCLLVQLRGATHAGSGNWLSALALFAYAAAFSFAYRSLSAGTGALLLFGAVQVTMISYGLWKGERMLQLQLVGFMLALGGLVGLLLPGLMAPPLFGSLLMIGAGVAWGIYSIRGKTAGDPLRVTAGNFIRTVPIAAVLSVLMLPALSIDGTGFWYAVASGAITSGVGYAIWYTVLPSLKATQAGIVQLSVPVITAVGGILFLQETITLRLIVASVLVIGGVALVMLQKAPAPHHAAPKNTGAQN